MQNDIWKVLLGAVGDIRNVVETVVGWSRMGRSKGLLIVLNDININILVRDLVLLEIARAGNVDGLLDCWSSLGIRMQAKAQLQEAMQKLYNLVAAATGWASAESIATGLYTALDRNYEKDAYCFVDLGSIRCRTLQAMLPVLRAWLSSRLSLV